MTEDKKIVINVPENSNVAEIVIREGDAPKVLDPLPPIAPSISGVIGVPAEYLAKRISEPDQINQKRCHVIIDRSNISITLVVSEDDKRLRGEIKGTLDLHPKFIEFGINSKKSWDPVELGQFFKMNRAFFPDKSENMTLVTLLKNFEATVNSSIEKQKSETGDFKDNYSGVVQSKLPGAFKLKLPVFKGVPADDLEIEFYASVNGRTVTLQLFSPGANQLLEDLRDSVIDKEILRIAVLAPEIAIIEK